MLQKIGFAPGINKQITATTAEGQWIDCDNVRFRYQTPEKIGGWKQLGADNITGAARVSASISLTGRSKVFYYRIKQNFICILRWCVLHHPIKSTNTLTNAFSTIQRVSFSHNKLFR